MTSAPNVRFDKGNYSDFVKNFGPEEHYQPCCHDCDDFVRTLLLFNGSIKFHVFIDIVIQTLRVVFTITHRMLL